MNDEDKNAFMERWSALPNEEWIKAHSGIASAFFAYGMAHRDKRVAELEAELTRLCAVVEKLPKTADGVAVVPGMIVWEPKIDGEFAPFFCYGVYVFPDCPDHNMYAKCYSTREAALAARESESHDN